MENNRRMSQKKIWLLRFVSLSILVLLSSCAQKTITETAPTSKMNTKSSSSTSPSLEALPTPQSSTEVEAGGPSAGFSPSGGGASNATPDVSGSNASAASTGPKALPKFGFIFSGGGAKAWAHIGFLRELQKFKWPVHAVAGFEWGAVVAAIFAQNLSPNEVEWEMSKLKDFERTEEFLKLVFAKKSVAELKVPFVCPSLNLSKQNFYLLNRGQLQQLIPFCVSQPPLTPVYAQSVAVMTDIPSLAQHLRATGANRIVLINVLSQSNPRSFVNDYTSAENVLWVQAAAQMGKRPAGVDDVININLDDYGIKNLDLRREIIAKGAEISYDQIRRLAQKFGL